MLDFSEIYKDYLELNNIVSNILDCPGKGGNISVKKDNIILVKPSGIDLKGDRIACLIVDNENKGIINNNSYKETIMKPTMEYELHKVMNFKYVIHYHPVYVLPYLCSVNCDLYPLVSALPGKDLYEKIKVYKNEKLIYLKNHGIVISSNSIDEIKNIYNDVKNKYFFDTDYKYTPDDIVDKNSEDLWLFRNAIENIASKKNIKLDPFNHYELLENEDEKYRMRSMK